MPARPTKESLFSAEEAEREGGTPPRFRGPNPTLAHVREAEPEEGSRYTFTFRSPLLLPPPRLGEEEDDDVTSGSEGVFGLAGRAVRAAVEAVTHTETIDRMLAGEEVAVEAVEESGLHHYARTLETMAGAMDRTDQTQNLFTSEWEEAGAPRPNAVPESAAHGEARVEDVLGAITLARPCAPPPPPPTVGRAMVLPSMQRSHDDPPTIARGRLLGRREMDARATAVRSEDEREPEREFAERETGVMEYRDEDDDEELYAKPDEEVAATSGSEARAQAPEQQPEEDRGILPEAEGAISTAPSPERSDTAEPPSGVQCRGARDSVAGGEPHAERADRGEATAARAQHQPDSSLREFRFPSTGQSSTTTSSARNENAAPIPDAASPSRRASRHRRNHAVSLGTSRPERLAPPRSRNASLEEAQAKASEQSGGQQRGGVAEERGSGGASGGT